MGLFDFFNRKKKEQEEQLRRKQEAELKRQAMFAEIRKRQEEREKEEKEMQKQLNLQQEAELKRREEEQQKLEEVHCQEEFKRDDQEKKANAYLAIFSTCWCGPSKRFIKEIEEAGINNFTVIDAEKEEALSAKFEITNVPTVFLLDERNNIIKKWVGYDDDDPGQSKFVSYIKNSPYNILPFSESPLAEAHRNVMTILEGIIGTEEKPAKVEKQKLTDGTIYTGEARLLTNGNYQPYGLGKKYVNQNLEITGFWKEGRMHGVYYMNMHKAMITGHFVDSQPDGWCLNIEGGKGFVFGVFKVDDCVYSFGESVLWMIRSVNVGVRTNSAKKQILIGEIANNKAKGFHFMDDGDVYVGTDNSKFDKTGYFFKFTKDGYVQIGRFENGVLVETLPPQDVVLANGISPDMYSGTIDTNKKYF